MKRLRQWLLGLFIPSDAFDIAVLRAVRLEPGDVVIMTSDRALSQATVARLRSSVEELLPGNKVLVIGDGLGMKVLRGAKPQPPLGRLIRENSAHGVDPP
jgi:hypothetical protein